MAKFSRTYKILILLLFILSIILRAGLVRYNRWSNDDHVPVVEYILETRKLPEKPDCYECFQPKLFYYIAVKILDIPWFGDALRELGLAKALGRINFFAGLATLLVLGVFISKLPEKREVIKLFSFGLVALNPKLIGINSQASNDTFAILFSTLAIYFTFLFLKKQKPTTFFLVILFVQLGISSKSNTWVTAIAITLALFIKAWTLLDVSIQPLLVASAFGITILTLSILNPLNQYISNYKKFGSPILSIIEASPFPHFFEKTYPARPGILSLYDGIFTFKFFDLLQYPLIDNGEDYSESRTSLWTQLYGRAHSLHFDNWPKIWASGDTRNFARTRIIYLLATLPTFLLLFGVFLNLYTLLKSILIRDSVNLLNTQYGLAPTTFIGYIFFIVIYSLIDRGFPVMKAIFIYPALITYPFFFHSGIEYIRLRINDRFNWIWIVFIVWMAALLVFYVLDVWAMIQLINSRVNIN